MMRAVFQPCLFQITKTFPYLPSFFLRNFNQLKLLNRYLKMATLKILFNTLKTLFQFKSHSNLVYDNDSFQIKGNTIVLEDDLEIQLPKRLQGKNIKQVELIPKFKSFEVIFTYQQNQQILNHQERKANNRILSINLGLEHLATSTNKMMWFLFMNKTTTPRFL